MGSAHRAVGTSTYSQMSTCLIRSSPPGKTAWIARGAILIGSPVARAFHFRRSCFRKTTPVSWRRLLSLLNPSWR